MTMRILAAVLLVSLAAPTRAQVVGCSQPCPWGGVCCEGLRDSFVTTHSWSVTSPGHLELTATGYTIQMVGERFSLYFGGGLLDAFSKLSDARAEGVRRARERQEIGLPLK